MGIQYCEFYSGLDRVIIRLPITMIGKTRYNGLYTALSIGKVRDSATAA